MYEENLKKNFLLNRRTSGVLMLVLKIEIPSKKLILSYTFLFTFLFEIKISCYRNDFK